MKASEQQKGDVTMKADKKKKTKMEQKQQQKQEGENVNKEFEDLQFRSGHSKPPFRPGSNPVFARLTKTASILSSYPIAPFSPGRDPARCDYASRVRSNAARGHSGPIISIIPKEARGKKKDSGFESQEPTSPKVSCIGQVKLKKIQVCQEKPRRSKERPPPPAEAAETRLESSSRQAKISKLKSLFSCKKKRTPEPVELLDPPEVVKFAEVDFPKLGQLKQFKSGREHAVLANIYTDLEIKKDERNIASDDEDERNCNKISHSGPMERCPKSEINLWKRRSVAPPEALNLRGSHGLETRFPLTT